MLKFLEKNGPMDEDQAQSLMYQMGSALQHLFKLDIMHRDLKPQNVLLHKKNGKLILKLADFGLAKEIDNFKNIY